MLSLAGGAVSKVKATIEPYFSPSRVAGDVTSGPSNGKRRAIGKLEDSQYVWIDAICINQNDVVERSTQVQIMSKFFERAIRVVIWLGEGNPNSDVGMATVRSLANNHLDQFNGMLPKRDSEAVLEFCSRPFWDRLGSSKKWP